MDEPLLEYRGVPALVASVHKLAEAAEEEPDPLFMRVPAHMLETVVEAAVSVDVSNPRRGDGSGTEIAGETATERLSG